MSGIDFAEIAARWKWDGLRATRRRVAVAVRRTGHPLGITCHGRPYLEPRVGMRVVTYDGRRGKIIGLRGRGEPVAFVKLSDGRTVHLYQTALRGYSVL